MGRADLDSKQALQAVVLADSFSRHLAPVTYARPKALLPLVNTPLIEYALHFLEVNGVEEVFVVCRAFAGEITRHLDETAHSKVSIRTIIVSDECCSVGDVFRHLDAMEIIQSDPFVVIGADTVADLDLRRVLQQHKQRSEADPLNIMTVIFNRAEPKHRVRSHGDELMVAISESTQQLLSYESDCRRSFIDTEIEVMRGQTEVRFHSDLLDTHILVCSPEVLKLFSDQFDMQTVENDFFNQVLGNSILGHRVFGHIVRNRYAARVNCWKSFDAISKDIIERWAFYFSVDHNVFKGNNYSYQRVNVFKEHGVRLAQSSVVEENSVIGSGTVLGENSSVSRSVIGRDCVIGSNVCINGSYVWNNVIIEDNVTIDRAVLCDNVVIKKGAYVHRGTILSFGVALAEGISIPAFTKAWLPVQHEDTTFGDAADDGFEGDDEFGDGADASKSSEHGSPGIGENCIGCLFRAGVDDEDDEYADGDDESDSDVPDISDNVSDMQKREKARISANSIAPDLEAITWWDDLCRQHRIEKANEEGEEHWDAESVLTFGSQSEQDDADSLAGDSDTVWDAEHEERFRVAKLYREIAATIRRSVEQNITDKEAIDLEVSSLKFSDNASISNYAASVFLAVFDEIVPTPEPRPAKPSNAVLKSLSRKLQDWMFLLSKYAQEESDQALLLKGLVTACLYDGKPYNGLFSFVLQALYKFDVLGDDVILEWADKCENVPDTPEHDLCVASNNLIEMLRESDDDEDDSDEDSDED